MVDSHGNEIEGDKFVNGAKSVLKPTGEKYTKKITRHFINQDYLDFCNEIYGFYHKEDGGDGKNKYEIDTCEIE